MKNLFYTVLLLSFLIVGTIAVSRAQNESPDNSGSAPMTKEETISDIQKKFQSAYADKLSFEVTEDKLLAFVRMAIRVEKINSKWDIMVAAAETDKMAIEYNNFAIEEVNKEMESIEGLTFDEYQALTRLTVEDSEFNKFYQIYKQLVQEGYFDTKQPAKESKPPAGPVNPDKAPAPRG